jgi:hypothetical protein
MCMMWDEQQLRKALREEIEGPAPAVQTQLSDIMPRGLRRRRMRQVSSIAAAVAVVVGLGVVASTLDSKPSSSNEPALPTVRNSTTKSANAEARWGRADLPPRSPYATWAPGNTAPPPPGYPKLDTPMCDAEVGELVHLGEDPIPPEFNQRLKPGLKAVAPSSKIGEVADSSRKNSYELNIDVGDGAGVGSVRIIAGPFGGKPLEAADRHAFERGNCQPPKREVRPDGTVLQVYSVVPSEPFQSLTQALVIYRTDGTRVAVIQQTWGSADTVLDKKSGAYNRTGKGRPTLPLSELQLAELGDRLTTK